MFRHYVWFADPAVRRETPFDSVRPSIQESVHGALYAKH